MLFNKDVARALMLNQTGIHLRCLGYQWPCIIYSSSMNDARVIVNTKSGMKEIIETANSVVSLNYSFIQKDKNNPISIFMKSKVINYAPYDIEKPDLSFMNLKFVYRPPDEIIYRLGELMDAQTKAHERKDERIVITQDTMRKLGIPAKNSFSISIEEIPRKCILRDLSFGGTRVIIFGVPHFLVNKNAEVKIRFQDPDELFTLHCKVLRFEEVQGRKDLAAFAIQFDEETIPDEYKIRLNNYYRTKKR